MSRVIVYMLVYASIKYNFSCVSYLHQVATLISRLATPEINEFTSSSTISTFPTSTFTTAISPDLALANFTSELHKFADSKSYAERQLYVRICHAALCPPHQVCVGDKNHSETPFSSNDVVNFLFKWQMVKTLQITH